MHLGMDASIVFWSNIDCLDNIQYGALAAELNNLTQPTYNELLLFLYILRQFVFAVHKQHY